MKVRIVLYLVLLAVSTFYGCNRGDLQNDNRDNSEAPTDVSDHAAEIKTDTSMLREVDSLSTGKSNVGEKNSNNNPANPVNGKH